MNNAITLGETLQVIRWTFFFPAGIVILFFALARAPLEQIGDHSELIRKVFAVALVLFIIRAFPFAMQTVANITSDYRPPPAGDIDMGKLIELRDSARELDTPIPWTSEWIDMYLKSLISDVTVFLIWAMLYLPYVIGRFLSGVLISAAIKFAIVISPLMLPMITMKETKPIGIRFIMTSIALAISPVGIVLIDAFLREEFLASMLVLLIPSLGGMVGSGAALGEIAFALAVKAGICSAGPQVFVFFGIILVVAVGSLFLLTSVYALSGFILIKIITSGGFISGVTGGFSSAGGAARSAAMPLIEGAEAARRTIKDGSKDNNDNKSNEKDNNTPSIQASKTQEPPPQIEVSTQQSGGVTEKRRIKKPPFIT